MHFIANDLTSCSHANSVTIYWLIRTSPPSLLLAEEKDSHTRQKTNYYYYYYYYYSKYDPEY